MQNNVPELTNNISNIIILVFWCDSQHSVNKIHVVYSALKEYAEWVLALLSVFNIKIPANPAWLHVG